MRLWVTLGAVVLVASILSGCAGNDRTGEQIDLRPLSLAELDQYAAEGTESGKFLSRLNGDAVADFQKKRLELDPYIKTDSDRSPLLAAVAPIVIGAAIDFGVKQLNDVAESFEAQWGASRVKDGFYKLDNNTWHPQYVGVEIVRSTSKYPKSEGGASRIVLLFLPSKSDDRLFLVYPMFYGNRSAKARLAGAHTLAADLGLTIDATWIGSDKKAVQTQVASAKFEVTGYDLDAPAAQFWGPPDQDSAGWFAAGPIEPKDGSTTAGVYRIGIAVTERDESKARQWIERGSKYLSDNKDDLIGKVSGK